MHEKSQELSIRYAENADAPYIHRITLDAFSKYAHDLGQPDRVKALNETQKDVILDIENHHVLVGLQGEEVIGSVRFEAMGEIAYLYRFGVATESHNAGMGGLLVRAVENECKKLGVKAIALHTSSKMANLVRFYYNAGYYIHSTTFDRGYCRALLINELKGGELPDLADVLMH